MNTINTSEVFGIPMENPNLNDTTFNYPLPTADIFDSNSIIEKSYNNSYPNEEKVKADLKKNHKKTQTLYIVLCKNVNWRFSTHLQIYIYVVNQITLTPPNQHKWKQNVFE
ncbi:hypothetical protein QTN25_010598 [Entamoeba marina]